MIIGQFNDSYMPIMDGVAITVKNYAYYLNKKYGKCVVVTPNFPKYKDEEDFEVIRYTSIAIPARPPYRLGIPILDGTLNKKLGKFDFDLLHAHSPFSSGKIALKIAKEKNIPIVATFHSKYYDDFKETLKLDILANYGVKKVIQFFNQVDHVYTLNESTIETIRSYGFKGDISVVVTGTDLEDSQNLEEDRIFINKKYNLSDDTKVLLFVGQHIWQKNVKFIIESLNELKTLTNNYKMFFVGDGFAKPEMEKLVNRLNLNDQVIFTGQISDRELLRKYYARADLFLFPSLYDTMGQVVREAANAYTPSLVIKDSNAAEVIDDGYNGYVIGNNVKEFANKIYNIVNDKDRGQIAKNAKETLVMSYEKVVDEVSELYKEIIKSHKQY